MPPHKVFPNFQVLWSLEQYFSLPLHHLQHIKNSQANLQNRSLLYVNNVKNETSKKRVGQQSRLQIFFLRNPCRPAAAFTSFQFGHFPENHEFSAKMTKKKFSRSKTFSAQFPFIWRPLFLPSISAGNVYKTRFFLTRENNHQFQFGGKIQTSNFSFNNKAVKITISFILAGKFKFSANEVKMNAVLAWLCDISARLEAENAMFASGKWPHIVSLLY